MKLTVLKSAFVVIGMALALPYRGRAVNPIVQTIYTADPAPLIHRDTVYVYTGHDEDNSTWFTMKDWRVYSSKDMANWTDHGSPLSLKDFSWAKDNAWAGHTIERNGKFYWYVPVEQKTGGMAIGVAVADGPLGPFRDALGKPLIFDGFGDIDPAAFLDTNGQAYLVWGNPTYKYVKLNSDMVSYDTSVGDKGIFRGPMTVAAFGKRKTTDRDTAYEEGPWLYQRNGIYYHIYAGGPVPEHIAYATGPSPEGPWKYGGVVIPTQGRSFTDHAGVVDFKGKTYIFYHNGDLPGGGGFTRSVCVDELKFNADGSIPPFDMTKEGVAAVAHLNPYVRTEAETIAWASGIETEKCREGGMNVTDIDDGDFIRVMNVDFGATGASAFLARVASDAKPKASKGSTIELHLDTADGPLIGTVPVSDTGGAWKTEAAAVTGATGVHDLFFVFKGEPTGDLFKFDFWQFDKRTAAPQLIALNAFVDRYKIDTASGANRANLKVAAIYSDGTSKDVTAQARIVPQEAGIATVQNGVITGVQFGATIFTASFGGKTDTVQMTVKDLKTEFVVRKLSITPMDVKILTGSQQAFSATAEYSDGHTEDATMTVTCEVVDPSIVSITNDVITAKARGATVIQASLNGGMGSPACAQIHVSVANRNPFSQNEAEEFSEHHGAVIENSTETAKNVCDMTDGEWLKYNALDFGSGAKSFEIRVASATEGGNLELRLDRLDGPVIGTLKVGNTGGWQNWVTKQCELKEATGVHDIYLKFSGGPGVLFNVNSWKFTR